MISTEKLTNVEQGTMEWLKLRKQHVTASDYVKCHKQSMKAMWALVNEKRVEPQQMVLPQFVIGHCIEDLLERDLIDGQEDYTHGDIYRCVSDPLMASLDFTIHGDTVVECKSLIASNRDNVVLYSAYKKKWELQLKYQMLLSGMQKGKVVQYLVHPTIYDLNAEEITMNIVKQNVIQKDVVIEIEDVDLEPIYKNAKEIAEKMISAIKYEEVRNRIQPPAETEKILQLYREQQQLDTQIKIKEEKLKALKEKYLDLVDDGYKYETDTYTITQSHNSGVRNSFNANALESKDPELYRQYIIRKKTSPSMEVKFNFLGGFDHE